MTAAKIRFRQYLGIAGKRILPPLGVGAVRRSTLAADRTGTDRRCVIVYSYVV